MSNYVCASCRIPWDDEIGGFVGEHKELCANERYGFNFVIPSHNMCPALEYLKEQQTTQEDVGQAMRDAINKVVV